MIIRYRQCSSCRRVHRFEMESTYDRGRLSRKCECGKRVLNPERRLKTTRDPFPRGDL